MTLLARFQSFPRAIRWAILGAAVIILYFAVVEPVLDLTNRFSAKADLLAASLRKIRALQSADSDQGRVLASGQASFGTPLLPIDPANTPDAIHHLVDRVLETQGVSVRTTNERRIPLRDEEFNILAGGAGSIDRFILDVTFDATPETVTAIVAQLEQSPQVAAVSRVEVRRPEAGRSGSSGAAPAGRTVKATVSSEAWIVAASRIASAVGGPGRSNP